MQGGEPCRRDTTYRAVRSALAVVAAPTSDFLAGLVQRLEPLLVQALVAELAVEALHVGVLGRFARVVDQVLDTSGTGPGHEGPARELRPLICPDDSRAAAKLSDPLLQYLGDVLGADALVDRAVHALAAEVVDTVRHVIRRPLASASITKIAGGCR
jgi:hypothetical protein